MNFKVECSTCQSRLAIPEELWQKRFAGRLQGLKCKKCGGVITVDDRPKEQSTGPSGHSLESSAVGPAPGPVAAAEPAKGEAATAEPLKAAPPPEPTTAEPAANVEAAPKVESAKTKAEPAAKVEVASEAEPAKAKAEPAAKVEAAPKAEPVKATTKAAPAATKLEPTAVDATAKAKRDDGAAPRIVKPLPAMGALKGPRLNPLLGGKRASIPAAASRPAVARAGAASAALAPREQAALESSPRALKPSETEAVRPPEVVDPPQSAAKVKAPDALPLKAPEAPLEVEAPTIEHSEPDTLTRSSWATSLKGGPASPLPPLPPAPTFAAMPRVGALPPLSAPPRPMGSLPPVSSAGSPAFDGQGTSVGGIHSLGAQAPAAPSLGAPLLGAAAPVSAPSLGAPPPPMRHSVPHAALDQRVSHAGPEQRPSQVSAVAVPAALGPSHVEPRRSRRGWVIVALGLGVFLSAVPATMFALQLGPWAKPPTPGVVNDVGPKPVSVDDGQAIERPASADETAAKPRIVPPSEDALRPSASAAAGDVVAESASAKAAAIEAPAAANEGVTPDPGSYEARILIPYVDQLMERVSHCHEGGRANGTAELTLKFAPTGHVSEATLVGEPIASAPVSRCIMAHARALILPAFRGDAIEVKRTLVLD